MDDLLVGVGIALVIEGLLYAAFPETLKSFLRQMLELPGDMVRLAGLCCLLTGVFFVWLVRG